ncbi:MAG TPA: FtsX-like permease family protein [Candidatus Binataceae bacterium]|nr:FtsX-like permease family protein [Candidatus Binataceae bacterium]
MKYALLVFKNLTRNKRRTVLTIISIAVSLFVFSALVSLPSVANEILADSASSLRVACHNKAGLTYSMPQAYRLKIRSTPHVVAAVAESWFGGIYHDVNDQFPNMAVDADQVDQVFPDWGVTPEEWAAFERLRTACLVGQGTMKRFNLHVGQQIMLRGTVYPFNITLQIVGYFKQKGPPNFLWFRRDYLEEAAGEPGFVDLFWARVDSAAAVPTVIAALDEKFANSSAETQSESESAFIGSFINDSRAIFHLAEALGIVVVLTIGLVAANTAAMSIRERRSEIAVMRSMGFPSPVILRLLLAESLIIGLAGGLLGCAGAYFALKVLTVGLPAIGGLSLVRMPALVLLETLVAAAVIGILSALAPARAAARQNIVDALRMVA